MKDLEFLKAVRRYCKDRKCEGCQFCEKEEFICGIYNEVKEITPQFIVEKINEWAKENPEKTMIMDFFEKFPNAPKDEDGTPKVCPHLLGYRSENICDLSCVDCWNSPLEE